MQRHWEREAGLCDYPAEAAVGHVRDFIARMPDLASQVLGQCREQGLNTPALRGLVDDIAARCRVLALSYGNEIAPQGDDEVADDDDGNQPE